MPQPDSSILPLIEDGQPFLAADGRAFIRLNLPGSAGRVVPLRSRAFRDWFFFRHYSERDSIPSTKALTAAIHLLESRASQESMGATAIIFRRVGYSGLETGTRPSEILLDLANS